MHPILRQLRESLQPSLEGAPADGQTRAEKELVYYGKIVDMGELEKADSKEEQEQWEIRSKDDTNAYGGCVRIRCINGKQYILTTKTFKPEKGHLSETETELPAEVGKNMMEEFKKLSSGGMIKTRYLFKVPDSDLVWEVDVYFDDKGEARQWCKIDLEVNDLRVKRPELPIQLKEVREIPAKNRSEDDQRFLERLMDREFVSPNPYKK